MWAVPSPYTSPTEYMLSYSIAALGQQSSCRNYWDYHPVIVSWVYIIPFPHTVTREIFLRFSTVLNLHGKKKNPKVVQTWSPIITPVQNLCAFSFMQFAFWAFVNGFQPGPLPFLVNGDFALKSFWANKIRGQLWTQGQHGHC